MRIGKWRRLLFAAVPLMAGCAGFWNAPSTSTTTTTTTTLSSGNFYILNKGTTTSAVYGFSIVSGTLTALSGSPYTVTGVAYAMAIDPTGSFLYVSSTAGIYLYTINSTTGALTQSSLVSQDSTGAAIAVSAGDNWLIEASDAGVLNAIPITSSGDFDNSGKRLQQSVALAITTGQTSAQIQQMAISGNSPLAALAVALGSTGTQIFPLTPTATANPIGAALPVINVKTAASGASIAVAMDPLNRLMYIGETSVFPSSSTTSGGLRVFTITATSTALTLTEISGSPYASGGTGPHAISSDATGDYVYVASWLGTSAGLVTPFQITTSGSSYSLTGQTNTVATGTEPFGMTEDNTGNFMLEVNYSGNPSFDAYIFDTTTSGKLDSTNTDSTTSSPIAVVAAP